MSPESHQEQGRGGRRGRREKEDTPASLRRKIQILENEFEMGIHVGKNEDKAMDRLKRMKRKLRDMSEKEDSNVELKDARAAPRLQSMLRKRPIKR